MNTELLKKHIQKGLEEAVKEFQKRDDIQTAFGKPIVAYVNPDDVRFDMLFARGYMAHPKEIYRPGKCLILHYTPYDKNLVERNEAAKEPTEEWLRADRESLWLAMQLNAVIRKWLDGQGRLSSYLNTMVEWNEKTCQEKWSHKMALAIGGVGEIGPAGSLIVNGSYGGRAGGIITDGLYAEPAAEFTAKEQQQAFEKLIQPRLYEGPCRKEMIAVCPGGAISEQGIDCFKCQDYCKTLDKATPMPEVCGKCFRFGVK